MTRLFLRGSYTLDGNALKIEIKITDGKNVIERKVKLTIKKLTATEFLAESESGFDLKLTRNK